MFHDLDLFVVESYFLGEAASTTPPTAAVPAQGLPGHADSACPAEAPIKVSRSGIYHLPGTANYEATKARACFATPEAAEAPAPAVSEPAPVPAPPPPPAAPITVTTGAGPATVTVTKRAPLSLKRNAST